MPPKISSNLIVNGWLTGLITAVTEEIFSYVSGTEQATSDVRGSVSTWVNWTLAVDIL
jgi:hypothetical protein